MNLLLVNVEEEVVNDINKQTGNKDTTVFSSSTLTDIRELLVTTECSKIVLNINEKDIDWLAVFAVIRSSSDFSKIKILVKSENKDKKFLKSVVMLGASQMIIEKISHKEFVKRILDFAGISGPEEKRKYFRVALDPGDEGNIFLNIPVEADELKNENVIKGKIRDLSLVAFAFECIDANQAQLLNEGMLIEKVKIQLNQKIANTNIKIERVGSAVIGFFEDQAEDCKNVVYDFIYEKMTEKTYFR